MEENPNKWYRLTYDYQNRDTDVLLDQPCFRSDVYAITLDEAAWALIRERAASFPAEYVRVLVAEWDSTSHHPQTHVFDPPIDNR